MENKTTNVRKELIGEIVLKLTQLTEDMDLEHILIEINKSLKLEEDDY